MRLGLTLDLGKTLRADHLAKAFGREAFLLERHVRGQCWLGLATETGNLRDVRMARVRRGEQALAQRMELVMRAITRLEERDVG